MKTADFLKQSLMKILYFTDFHKFYFKAFFRKFVLFRNKNPLVT